MSWAAPQTDLLERATATILELYQAELLASLVDVAEESTEGIMLAVLAQGDRIALILSLLACSVTLPARR